MQFHRKQKKNYLPQIIIIIILISIFYYIVNVIINYFGGDKIQNYLKINFTTYQESTINFASINLDAKRPDWYFLKTNLEKEILMTLYSEYQLVLWIKRTGLYFPYIEKRLSEEGLPDDLKYITVAESFLRNDALSSAGAKGLWQFIPGTAKQYGLIIDDYVDERLNYEKATNSAIQYLKFLGSKFDGDWSLAMAGYNMGENGLITKINQQGQSDYFKLRLNEETSRYVYRVIAMKYTFDNKETLGISIPKDHYYKFPETKSINVREITDIRSYANEFGNSEYEFYQANPWILGKDNILPPRQDGNNRDVKILLK